MTHMGNRFRLVASLTLVAVVVAGAIVLTRSSPSPVNPSTTAARLVEPGKLTIGYFADYPHIDVENGKGAGIDGVVMQRIAERLGLTPVWVPYGFAALIPALQSRRVDTIATSLSFTQPRAQILYYTQPITFGRETLTVKPTTHIDSWQDAADRGLTLATVNGFYQLGAWEELGIKSHAFDSTDACLEDVLADGAAGCAIGSLTLIHRKATNPTDPVAGLVQIDMHGPGVLGDVTGFGVAQDNPVLATQISQAITELWRDGGIDDAYRSVFGTADYSSLISPARDQAMYFPGPWETGVVPTAPQPIPSIQTAAAGTLTVGVVSDSSLLRLDGGRLSGPEGTVLDLVASRLGLKVKGVRAARVGVSEGIDLMAGQLASTPDHTGTMWMSTPIGFSPDYIYVKPADDGSLPSYTRWEDIRAAGGKIAVQADDPRAADLGRADIPVLTVPSAADGLRAVVTGAALGFVGRSTDYAVAVSENRDLGAAGIGWVRNINLYTRGEAYAWGVKPGDGAFLDAVNQGITMAWQERVVADAFASAWPGANPTAVSAPGPASVGTSFLTSKDYRLIGMDLSGPWLQRPTH
jgi:ABC-type amino acid transport substrate-binding protein